jgi:hypothetical protein
VAEITGARSGDLNEERPLSQPSESSSVQASLLKIAGSHSMKFGMEYRILHWAAINISNGDASYSFSRSWTSSNPQVTDSAAGNSIASALLGHMSGASATLNVAPYYGWHYPVAYFQDDWQITRRLALNLGLRWDYETPVVERYNRMVRGYDFGAASPAQVPGLNPARRAAVRQRQRCAAGRLRSRQNRVAATLRHGL